MSATKMRPRKFLARGYRVGRVDQSETALGAEMRVAAAKSGKSKDAQESKKIVKRELNKVLTIGTLMDGNLLPDDYANHCVAVVEEAHSDNRHKSQFGVAILDAATSEIMVGFWEDDTCRTNLETMIRQLRVRELLHCKVKGIVSLISAKHV